jgi:hypothetical protein
VNATSAVTWHRLVEIVDVEDQLARGTQQVEVAKVCMPAQLHL